MVQQKCSFTQTYTTQGSPSQTHQFYWPQLISKHASGLHKYMLHANLSGAFGFNAGGYFNLATAMVLVSKASASSWEPFCWAIEALSAVYAKRPDLMTKHKYYLDMILWQRLTQRSRSHDGFLAKSTQGSWTRKGPQKSARQEYLSRTLCC